MDPSRLDYERSLALHEAVAVRLRAEPAILDRARARIEEWIAHGGRSTVFRRGQLFGQMMISPAGAG